MKGTPGAEERKLHQRPTPPCSHSAGLFLLLPTPHGPSLLTPIWLERLPPPHCSWLFWHNNWCWLLPDTTILQTQCVQLTFLFLLIQGDALPHTCPTSKCLRVPQPFSWPGLVLLRAHLTSDCIDCIGVILSPAPSPHHKLLQHCVFSTYFPTYSAPFLGWTAFRFLWSHSEIWVQGKVVQG